MWVGAASHQRVLVLGLFQVYGYTEVRRGYVQVFSYSDCYF